MMIEDRKEKVAMIELASICTTECCFDVGFWIVWSQQHAKQSVRPSRFRLYIVISYGIPFGYDKIVSQRYGLRTQCPERRRCKFQFDLPDFRSGGFNLPPVILFFWYQELRASPSVLP